MPSEIQPIYPGLGQLTLGLKDKRRRQNVFRNITPAPRQNAQQKSDRSRYTTTMSATNPLPALPAAPNQKKITPAPKGAPVNPDIATINVSPLRAPGTPVVGRAEGTQSLAARVAAARPESQILPGGTTPEQVARRADLRQANEKARPQGYSITGGLTPAADQNKPAEVYVPRVPSSMRPQGPVQIDPTADLGNLPITPQAAITGPAAPQLQKINPMASAEYARQEGGQAQVAAAPSPIMPAPAQTAGTGQTPVATPQIDVLAARKAIEGFGYSDKEAAGLVSRAQSGDQQAMDLLNSAIERRTLSEEDKKAEAARKETQSRIDREDTISRQEKRYKQSREDSAASAALDDAKAAESRAKSALDEVKAEIKALEKQDYPDEQGKLTDAKRRLAEAQKSYDTAVTGTKDARSGRQARYGGKITPAPRSAQTPAPVAPEKEVIKPLPPTADKDAIAARKAGERVGRSTLKEMDQYIDNMMFGKYSKVAGGGGTMAEAAKKGEKAAAGYERDPKFPGLLWEVNLHEKDEKGKPKYGYASVGILNKGLNQLKNEYSSVRLGVDKKDADRVATAAFVSWMGTNEHLYPEAVKAWKKENPKLWKKYAPAATAESAPGGGIPKGNGQNINDKIANKYYDEHGGDIEKAREAARSDGWRF